MAAAKSCNATVATLSCLSLFFFLVLHQYARFVCLDSGCEFESRVVRFLCGSNESQMCSKKCLFCHFPAMIYKVIRLVIIVSATINLVTCHIFFHCARSGRLVHMRFITIFCPTCNEHKYPSSSVAPGNVFPVVFSTDLTSSCDTS